MNKVSFKKSLQTDGRCRNKSGKNPITCYFAFCALIVVISACNTDNASFDTDISVPVSVAEVKTKSIEQYVNTTGSVFAMQETTLLSETVGDYYLLNNPKTGKPFMLGDKIDAGQKIIRIENAEYENNIKKRFFIKNIAFSLKFRNSRLDIANISPDKFHIFLRSTNANINKLIIAFSNRNLFCICRYRPIRF